MPHPTSSFKTRPIFIWKMPLLKEIQQLRLNSSIWFHNYFKTLLTFGLLTYNLPHTFYCHYPLTIAITGTIIHYFVPSNLSSKFFIKKTSSKSKYNKIVLHKLCIHRNRQHRVKVTMNCHDHCGRIRLTFVSTCMT